MYITELIVGDVIYKLNTIYINISIHIFFSLYCCVLNSQGIRRAIIKIWPPKHEHVLTAYIKILKVTSSYHLLFNVKFIKYVWVSEINFQVKTGIMAFKRSDGDVMLTGLMKCDFNQNTKEYYLLAGIIIIDTEISHFIHDENVYYSRYCKET